MIALNTTTKVKFERRHPAPDQKQQQRVRFICVCERCVLQERLQHGRVPREARQRAVVQSSWNIAPGASATASLACVSTWGEDFRKDVARVEVPTLVIHGDDDRIVPLAAADSARPHSSKERGRTGALPCEEAHKSAHEFI
jgi:pimeloyl-ACP methyl ester carboxylesterase